MTVFLINVNNCEYAKHSIPLIKKLCDFNKVNLFILDTDISQNIYKKHPSWLKLFCHDLVEDDFILCWDLDLVPTKLFELNFLDLNRINASYDRCFLTENFTFNGKFKYNCGLIGIPKSYKDLFKSIYHTKSEYSNYPSYEQYHVNDEIYDKNIPINLIDTKYNYLYDGKETESEILNMHYTWKINSNAHRVELIKNHFNKYNGNF